MKSLSHSKTELWYHPPHLKAPHLNDIPWLAHGFFGRKGGISEGEFSTLNTTETELAYANDVNANRKRIAIAVGMENAPTVLTEQKHTNTIVGIEKPFNGDEPIADAMVTKQKHIFICIQTAEKIWELAGINPPTLHPEH